MNKRAAYDFVVDEILKRERVPIPPILLTGKRFGDDSSVYSVFNVTKLRKEPNNFTFNVDTSFINLDDYQKELLYLKLFASTTEQKHITKGTCFIKITDTVDQVFYMYIKLVLKCQNLFEDTGNETKYRIIYSSSFDDLLKFIYRPKEIPDLLNSDAFVSKNDKTKEQAVILEEHAKTLITNVEYESNYVKLEAPISAFGTLPNIINIIINYNKRTISTTFAGKTFETKYKQRHEIFTNDIITKGRDNVNVTVYLYTYCINIVIKNDVETLKEFKLKEVPCMVLING
jgi:hypothetical protein